MRAPSAESAHRLGELALLTTAFVLPLAFYARTLDGDSIKYTILQWGSLTMLFAWLWQGVSRGRFQAPASSWTVLLPALAYGAWMILRFTTEPHKLGALPDFLTEITMLVGFLAAFLGFAGARCASRFATLTIAAAWIIIVYGLSQAVGGDSFSTLGDPYHCASFLAVAVPLALTLYLDPETPSPLRAAALLLLPSAGSAVLLTGSAMGAASFCASCVVYAAVLAAVLRTRQAFKTAGLALLVASVVGGASALSSTHDSMVYVPRLPVLGAVGPALCLWLFGAALWTGARGASALRRAGALTESTYAAGFCAAAAGALAAAHFGPAAGNAPSTGWYAWPLAGLAAGLAPLAARRAAVSVYPLPISESVRRALYAPGLLAFAGLALFPGLWLRSEVNLNSAIYCATSGQLSRALELYSKVLPGSRGYVMSLRDTGYVLNRLGRHEEALAAYDRLQAQAPDYHDVHAERGLAYAKLGDWPAAAAERARQAALDPRSIRNLTAWAEAARAAGDLDGARLAAGKAAALAPDDASVKLQLAANRLMERRLVARAPTRPTRRR